MSTLIYAGVIPSIRSDLDGYCLARASMAGYSTPDIDGQCLVANLQLEQRRFLCESRRLLSFFVRLEDVDDMLHQPYHHLWHKQSLEERLVVQFGRWRESLQSVLQTVGHILGKISEHGGVFSADYQTWNGENSGTGCGRTSHQILNPRLSEWVNDLSLSNDVFGVCVSQRCQLPPVILSKEVSPGEGSDRLEIFSKASSDLFTVLGRLHSCSIHREHTAYIKIKTSTDCTRKFTPPRVEFDLIWARSRESLTGSQRLTAKTTLRLPDYERTPRSVPTSEIPAEPPPKYFKKAYWGLGTTFHLWNVGKHEKVRSASGSVCRREQYLAYHQLSNISNLCVHLQVSDPNIGEDKPAMVIIESHTSAFEHLILPSPTVGGSGSSSMSLAEVISWVSQDIRVRGLGIPTKIRLAKLLAISVLQFQGTPWLQGGWRSQDIAFLDVTVDTLRQKGTLTSPYLKIQFPRESFIETLPIVPNNTLFGLAIVLLELGFETPFQSLHREEDFQYGNEAMHPELFAAQRLLGPIQRKLGLTYAKVVRKCINCDFWFGGTVARGGDLQLVFYTEVVCALEKLERKFV